jgi:hypothetical protein
LVEDIKNQCRRAGGDVVKADRVKQEKGNEFDDGRYQGREYRKGGEFETAELTLNLDGYVVEDEFCYKEVT